MTTIPTLARKCLVGICEDSECETLSRPTDIADSRECLATHYAVQNGETNERDNAKQTGDSDTIVSVLISSVPINHKANCRLLAQMNIASSKAGVTPVSDPMSSFKFRSLY